MKCTNFGLICILVALAGFLACSLDQSAQNWARKTELHWVKLKKSHPQWLEMLDSAALNAQLYFLRSNLQKSDEWLHKPIHPVVKTKLEGLRKEFTYAQTRLERQHQDPSLYNFSLRLQNGFGSTARFRTTDLEKLEKYLDQVSSYYAQARKKLISPEASQCNIAIHQHIVGIAFLQGDLNSKLETGQFSKEKIGLLRKKISLACFHMKDYLAWCRSASFERRGQRTN